MVDKIKDDFDEELDLYMYKEVNGSKEKPREMKNNDIKEKVDKKIDSKVEEDVKKEEKGEIEKDVNEIITDASTKLKKNVNIPAKKKKKTKSWIYTIILVLILAGLVYYNWGNLFSQPSITGQVVAVINGEELTEGEFNEIYSQIAQQYPAVDRDTVLDQTIDKMLLLQETKNKDIKVSDKEVDELVDVWLDQVKSTFTEEELQQQLDMQGITLEKLIEETKKNYKESLMINRLLNATILKEKEATLPEMVKASHILVDSEEEAIEILEEVKEKEFSEVAKEKSTGPSASVGGDLGWFGKGQMVKEFEDVVFSLKINEISEPVKTEFGYHIIKLEDKKDEETKLMSELNNEERNLVLIELQDVVAEYIEELRNKAEIKLYTGEEITEVTGFVTEEEVPEIILPEETEETPEIITEEVEEEIVGGIKTFKDTGDEVCKEDGKPVIRLFSTTWCPHCTWIKETFDNTVKEYMDEGKIIAYHWELDIKDDLLTEEIEEEVPASEEEVYQKYNPGGSIPTFVFGCKYSRIGNGYESQNDLKAEEAEFRAVIEELLE